MNEGSGPTAADLSGNGNTGNLANGVQWASQGLSFDGNDDYLDVGKRVQVINTLSEASNFLEIHHNLNEEIMKELGVSIIWYENYDEIPKLLNQISL